MGSEHQASLAQPARPEVFISMAQDYSTRMTLVVRAREGRDPAMLAPPTRRMVRDLDSLLAIVSVRPMTEVHRQAMSRQRFTSVLVLVFAVSGVVLALVGVFGVLAQLVQARWRELGIRMALGAQRSQVRLLIVRHGMRLLAAGIAVGLVVSLWSTRVLATRRRCSGRSGSGRYPRRNRAGLARQRSKPCTHTQSRIGQGSRGPDVKRFMLL